MMRGIHVLKTGGVDVLQLSNKIELPKLLEESQILIRNEFSGVNFIDTYHRTGFYQKPLPFVPGVEGVGIVEKVGSGVESSLVGARVGFYGAGSYAEYSVVDRSKVARVPDGLDSKTAAASIVQGLTAFTLANDVFGLNPSSTCVIHAAGGGTGQLLVQLAKRNGARVIGTSSPGKKHIGEALGAEMVSYDELVSYVKQNTNGGCDVVYDGVGKATYMSSLECLKRRGLLVLFGNASGPVPPVDPLMLTKHGSLFMTRPTVGDYVETQERFETRLDQVFHLVKDGHLKINIDSVFPLEEAGAAHSRIEAGKTTGKMLLQI